MSKVSNPVTLYVVPNCPLCEDTRQWLQGRGISFEELDVANNFGALRRMHKLTRQNLVPVIVFGDQTIVRPTHEQLGKLFLP